MFLANAGSVEHGSDQAGRHCGQHVVAIYLPPFIPSSGPAQMVLPVVDSFAPSPIVMVQPVTSSPVAVVNVVIAFMLLVMTFLVVMIVIAPGVTVMRVIVMMVLGDRS